MRFPSSVLDEIKIRLPISAVAGRRVRLAKAGREWKGLSPFNSEKTPSFFVNDDKQRYFDFSSGKNGDIFNFVMETEGLSFAEAVERLAAEAGVPLPRESAESERFEARRRSLGEVVELAAAFFEQELAGPGGARARSYLEGRGLGLEARRRFRLGYAPASRHALRDYLAAKGVDADTMVEAGLLVAGEDIPVAYDRFRDRVMFPIADPRGRMIAFGGRAMGDVQPKYLNSPETPLFHKGATLYNLHLARKAAHDAGTIVAVEGYVDVIAMSLAGVPQTVAPLGTALTEEQLGLLWRCAEEPVLCFDGDKAGRRAAYRAVDLALPLLAPGRTLRFALLPEGQDPDDLARSGGAAAVAAVLEATRPLVDLLWMREAEQGPLETPDQKAALELRLTQAVARIRDETLRKYYRAEIDERMAALLPRPAARRGGGSFPSGGAGRFQGSAPGRGRPGSPAGDGGPRARFAAAAARHPAGELARGGIVGSLVASGRDSPREALVLLVLIAHPVLLSRHCEELAHVDFSGRDARTLAGRLIDCAAMDEEHGEAFVEQTRAHGQAPEAGRLARLVLPAVRWALSPEANLDDAEEMLRQALTLHRRAGALNSELRAAELAFADDASEANLAWLRDVRTRLSSLDGTEADIDGFGHGVR